MHSSILGSWHSVELTILNVLHMEKQHNENEDVHETEKRSVIFMIDKGLFVLWRKWTQIRKNKHLHLKMDKELEHPYDWLDEITFFHPSIYPTVSIGGTCLTTM